MWIMTIIGFFSAVENQRDPRRETLLVRARAKQDLENLGAVVRALEPEAPEGERVLFEILSNPTADYPFRVVLSKEVFADVLAHIAEEVDYANFKDAVGHVSKKHATAYSKVWAALHALEEPR